MLTIVCGEDSISSYNYIVDLKRSYREKDYEIYHINSSDFEEVSKWMGESSSLFSQKKVYFTQGLNKKINKKTGIKFISMLEKLILSKEVEIIDYEENTQARFLKVSKGVVIKEFKPSQNIFKLQDSLIPDNFKQFHEMIQKLKENTDQFFLFTMISRHVRNLLLVKMGKTPSGMFSWQAAKLKSQASKWTELNLLSFYDGFHRIDKAVKTNGNPYSVADSLDILVSYYI